VRRSIAALCILMVIVVGCGGGKPEPVLEAQVEAEIKIPERAPYTFAVGDRFHVNFFYYPLYDQTVVVRPDGIVTFPLVGEIQAEGMRPSEMEQVIRSRYSEVVADPEVSVIMLEFADQRVFVFGEVKEPGAVGLGATMTLVDAIADAGGFLVSAKMESVILMRKDKAGSYTGRKVNVEEILESDVGESIYLMAGDVIYVPMSIVAKVDTFVDQFFDGMNPAWQWYIYGREVVNPEGKYLIGG
jgi:protein involved in polysaccharide export with SLBB domain